MLAVQSQRCFPGLVVFVKSPIPTLHFANVMDMFLKSNKGKECTLCPDNNANKATSLRESNFNDKLPTGDNIFQIT